MEKDILVKVTARNNPGLLQRVCALFSRRFFNIVSIVAAQSQDPSVPQHPGGEGVLILLSHRTPVGDPPYLHDR